MKLVDGQLTPVGALHWLSPGLLSFVRWEVFAIEHSVLRIHCTLRDYPQRPIHELCTHPVVTHELCHLMSLEAPYGHIYMSELYRMHQHNTRIFHTACRCYQNNPGDNLYMI